MNTGRRVVLTDLFVGGCLIWLAGEDAVVAAGGSIGPVRATAAVVVAVAMAALLSADEHGRLPAIDLDLDPLQVGMAILVPALAVLVGLVFLPVTFDADGYVALAVAAAGAGQVAYRLWFGVIRPVPDRRLAREREGW